MKLKFLLLATLATAGFMSCSQDDKVDPNATYDASISAVVAPSSETTATKASTSETPTEGTTGEQLVSRLTAFVFDASGSVVAISDTTNTANPTVSIDRIKNIVVKATEAGTAYQLFIVANLHTADAGLLSKGTLSNIQSAMTASLADETASSLTMSSQVLSITVKGKKDIRVYQNYLMNTNGSSIVCGEESKDSFESLVAKDNGVKLVRLVARVQLESLKVAFVGGNLERASFRLDSAYLVNVKPTSKFLGSDLTGDGYWNGTNGITVINNLIAPSAIQKGAPYVVVPSPKITLMSGNSTNNPYDFTLAANSANFLKAYVYENHIAEVIGTTYNTRLVLKGTVILSTGQSLGTSYYHIIIKNVADADYVLRNTIYKVNVTITGTGSPKEDKKSDLNAGINAKVTVVPWNVVNQTENDAN